MREARISESNCSRINLRSQVLVVARIFKGISVLATVQWCLRIHLIHICEVSLRQRILAQRLQVLRGLLWWIMPVKILRPEVALLWGLLLTHYLKSALRLGVRHMSSRHLKTISLMQCISRRRNLLVNLKLLLRTKAVLEFTLQDASRPFILLIHINLSMLAVWMQSSHGQSIHLVTALLVNWTLHRTSQILLLFSS